MDLATWIGIIGVLTTLAVGLPVYWLKRDHRSAGGPTSGSMIVNISQRHSQQTHHHYATSSSRDEDGDVWGYLAMAVGAAVLYWVWRPYLLVFLAALIVSCAALTWATQHWARPAGGRSEALLLLLAFGVISANCVLLVYPGLVWGDGFRLNWTFAQGAHLHGPGFALGALPLLATTVTSLLPLATRCLAIFAAQFAARSQSVRRAAVWERVAERVGPTAFARGVLWIAIGLALIGLLWTLAVPALAQLQFQPLQHPVHPAIQPAAR